MALELTLTEEDQVTPGQAVLAHLGAKPGQTVDVALLPNGRVRLRGILRPEISRSVTLEEMQEAIESVDYP